MTRASRANRNSGRTTPTPTASRPPVLLLSALALVAGVVAVMLIVVVGGGLGSAPAGAIATPRDPSPVALADGRSLGSADAPLQIDVWADFQCPICRHFTMDIEPALVARYVEPGDARLTFHDLAFLGPESIDAAVAARAAARLGDAFWPMHDLLFANQGAENSGAFGRDRLADLAVSIGLDRAAFLAALDDPALRADVQAETTSGRGLGIDSTPTMVINGTVAAGLPDWPRLQAYLDGLLASQSPAP